MAKGPAKISTTGNPLVKHWRLAAGALVLGGGLFALTQCGGDEPEGVREPAAASDTQDRVDPNQRFYEVERDVHVYANAQPGAQRVALLRPGDCAVLVGPKNEHTTTHILTEDGRMISGVSDFSYYINTDVEHQSECTADTLPMAADGRRLDTSFYRVRTGIEAPPLYTAAAADGGITGYIEGCFQVVEYGNEFSRARVTTPEGVREGYVQNINAVTFQITTGLTADTCQGNMHAAQVRTGAQSDVPQGVVSPSAPAPPPPQ